MKLDEAVSSETSGDKEKLDEGVSSDESNRVPVILYSSYEAGKSFASSLYPFLRQVVISCFRAVF
jgi:hypothetical protein